MEVFLNKPFTIPFSDVYLDPNNPRLAAEDAPGYDDPDALFDADRQERIAQQLSEVYNPESLVGAIISQGWMPIDNIVVWKHPDHPNGSVVVEGNTRILALRAIRTRVEVERKRLDRMEKGEGKKYAPHDIKAQRSKVEQLNTIIKDTESLHVVPLNAGTVEELLEKLPRVLAVRHITGAKGWGNYAEDLWLLQRYTDLFETQFPGKPMRWESTLIERVGAEASLSTLKTKRQLLSASAYSHFRGAFEDELPHDEQFQPGDYYLFENLVKKPFLRDQFGFGTDELHLQPTMEAVLFEWIFKLPRGHTADENPNKFYRHENVLVWDQMKRYDDKHRTGFALRFDVTDPDNVPTMRGVEADYLAHKARRKPQEILDELIRRLSEIPAESLRTEGEFLKGQLKRLRDQCDQFVDMIEAAEAVPAS